MTADVPASSDDPSGSFIEQARRAQIVAAATTVIAEKGFTNASFARIAAHARISPGLISYHFRNKAELIDAVTDHVIGALETTVTEHISGTSTYRETLVRLVIAEVDFFTTHPEEVAALSSIRSESRVAATGQPVVLAQRERAVLQIERLLRDGRQAGEFDVAEPRIVAVSLLGALEAVPGELAAGAESDSRGYGQTLAALTLQLAGVSPTHARAEVKKYR